MPHSLGPFRPSSIYPRPAKTIPFVHPRSDRGLPGCRNLEQAVAEGVITRGHSCLLAQNRRGEGLREREREGGGPPSLSRSPSSDSLARGRPRSWERKQSSQGSPNPERSNNSLQKEQHAAAAERILKTSRTAVRSDSRDRFGPFVYISPNNMSFLQTVT